MVCSYARLLRTTQAYISVYGQRLHYRFQLSKGQNCFCIVTEEYFSNVFAVFNSIFPSCTRQTGEVTGVNVMIACIGKLKLGLCHAICHTRSACTAVQQASGCTSARRVREEGGVRNTWEVIICTLHFIYINIECSKLAKHRCVCGYDTNLFSYWGHFLVLLPQGVCRGETGVSNYDVVCVLVKTNSSYARPTKLHTVKKHM